MGSGGILLVAFQILWKICKKKSYFCCCCCCCWMCRKPPWFCVLWVRFSGGGAMHVWSMHALRLLRVAWKVSCISSHSSVVNDWVSFLVKPMMSRCLLMCSCVLPQGKKFAKLFMGWRPICVINVCQLSSSIVLVDVMSFRLCSLRNISLLKSLLKKIVWATYFL